MLFGFTLIIEIMLFVLIVVAFIIITTEVAESIREKFDKDYWEETDDEEESYRDFK